MEFKEALRVQAHAEVSLRMYWWETSYTQKQNTQTSKIHVIIVNINKDENKSLISNQFSPKNDFDGF
jgi:hypothetical protein